MPDAKRPLSIATQSAHAGTTPAGERKPGEPFVPAIAQTTLFELGTAAEADALFDGRRAGYSYTRFGNPTVDRLAEAIAALEGGAGAMVTASGNAATLCAIVMSLRGHGDRLVAPADLYGGSLEVMRILREKFGLAVDLVAPSEPRWAAAVRSATVVYLESPTNPLMRLVDIAATAQARAEGAVVIVDNTVATPFNQRPLALGADVVVHSLSKYLNGHSDVIGGCVVTAKALTAEQRAIHKNLGGTFNAIDAWLTLRGLRTFALRMETHNRSGAEIARRLAAHPKIAKVYHPVLLTGEGAALYGRQMTGGSGLLSFELTGGEAAANRFLDRVRLVVHAVSLGGTESLATRPAATSHRGMTPAQRAAAGVTGGLVRLSVGIEDIEDIWHDLQQALD